MSWVNSFVCLFVCMRVTRLGCVPDQRALRDDQQHCALNRVLRGHFLGVKMLQCNIKSLAGPIVVEQLLES